MKTYLEFTRLVALALAMALLPACSTLGPEHSRERFVGLILYAERVEAQPRAMPAQLPGPTVEAVQLPQQRYVIPDPRYVPKGPYYYSK